jgi:F-type H+-transporting ATPase subunit b
MTFNLWTFLFEVLNFLVLAFVLHRLLYRPLHQAIDARRAGIEQAQADAEAARKQANDLQADLKNQVAALDEQRRQVLAEAHGQAEAERTRLLAAADQETQVRREEGRKALARERKDGEEELHAAMLELALDLAARLLGEVCTAELQHQLAVRLIEALTRLSEGDRSLLRANLSPSAGAVVETAMALDDITLAEINAAVATLLGQPVSITTTVRPELLAGLRLLLEGHVWDSSLAGQLEDSRHVQSAVPA